MLAYRVYLQIATPLQSGVCAGCPAGRPLLGHSLCRDASYRRRMGGEGKAMFPLINKCFIHDVCIERMWTLEDDFTVRGRGLCQLTADRLPLETITLWQSRVYMLVC